MNSLSNTFNLIKIKDTIYIGDITIGTNRELIEEFNITHIINSTNNISTNNLGFSNVKSINLNWMESPKQQLFNSNDENIIKLMKFIDNAEKNGEGLLIFSLKGKNRCYIVVIIYLIKKYNWTVNKCIDYIKSKTDDVLIPNYFMKQLIEFEKRNNKITNIKKSINWSEEENNRDKDENIMRNTYINTLSLKERDNLNNNNINNNKDKIIEETKNKNKNKNKKKIKWKDKIPNNSLVSIQFDKDLIFKENISVIKNHIEMKPKKSCIKKRFNNSVKEKEKNEQKNHFEKIFNEVRNKEKLEIKLRTINSSKRLYKNENVKFIFQNENPNSETRNNNILIQETMNDETEKKNKSRKNKFLLKTSPKKYNFYNNNQDNSYTMKVPFTFETFTTNIEVNKINSFLKDYSSSNILNEKPNFALTNNYFQKNHNELKSPSNGLKQIFKKRNKYNCILNKKDFSFSKLGNLNENKIKFNDITKKNCLIQNKNESNSLVDINNNKKKNIKNLLEINNINDIYKGKFFNEKDNIVFKRPLTANNSNKLIINDKNERITQKLYKRTKMPEIKTFSNNNIFNINNKEKFSKIPSLPNYVLGINVENEELKQI